LCFLMPVLQLSVLAGVATAAGWTNGVLQTIM
jgi:hypothetical protein